MRGRNCKSQTTCNRPKVRRRRARDDGLRLLSLANTDVAYQQGALRVCYCSFLESHDRNHVSRGSKMAHMAK